MINEINHYLFKAGSTIFIGSISGLEPASIFSGIDGTTPYTKTATKINPSIFFLTFTDSFPLGLLILYDNELLHLYTSGFESSNLPLSDTTPLILVCSD